MLNPHPTSPRIVYTCIVNGRDKPKSVVPSENVRFVMFTDDPHIEAPGWEVRPLAWSEDSDPWRVARWHKHHPIELFPDADASIWIDGTHAPVVDVNVLFDYLKGNCFAAFRSPVRNTVADEAAECIRLNLDYPQVIEDACATFREMGFPDKSGLFSSAVLVREHSAVLRDAEAYWWGLVRDGSRRDQISFPVVIWKHYLRVSALPGMPRSHQVQPGVIHRPNPFFDVTVHSAALAEKRSTCVLVLGNHRTGSSAVSEMLQHLGVNMGGPGEVVPSNPHGQFEDSDIFPLHQQMFGEHRNPDAWRNPTASFGPPRRQRQYRLCLQDKATQLLWGVKDPRLCFLLPHFIRSCPAHVEFKFVITNRPRGESIRSMAHRDGTSLEHSRKVLGRYQGALQQALLSFADVPNLTIRYDNLIDNPDRVSRIAAHFLGVPHTPAATESVDPSLRHWDSTVRQQKSEGF